MYEDDLASGTDYEYNMDFDRAMQESYTKSQNEKKIDYKQEFERLKRENEILEEKIKSYETFEKIALDNFLESQELIEKLELSLMTVPVKFQKIVYKIK